MNLVTVYGIWTANVSLPSEPNVTGHHHVRLTYARIDAVLLDHSCQSNAVGTNPLPSTLNQGLKQGAGTRRGSWQVREKEGDLKMIQKVGLTPSLSLRNKASRDLKK